MPSTAAYLVVGAIAALVTFATTPLVATLARKRGWVVEPDPRRVHTVATPDVGGIAMIIGFVAAFVVAAFMDEFDPLFARNSEPRGVLIAALLMFLVGFVDDIREISAPAKVVGTVMVGLVLVYYGVTMFYFRVPFLDVYFLSDDWVPLITVVWLLVMTQAINLIDGLDGLAAGIVAIGSASFFVYSHKLDQLGYLTPPNLGPLM
ncbi:MAG TPA: MraY family glycosyltransferase, partial [Ilumatobacteraceae bacterium]|nr:MraY family glycosyltransferase [Ilumatobacteraceae bacterium]